MDFRKENERTKIEGNPENLPGGYGHAGSAKESSEKNQSKEEGKDDEKGRRIVNTGIGPGEKENLNPGQDADASSG